MTLTSLGICCSGWRRGEAPTCHCMGSNDWLILSVRTLQNRVLRLCVSCRWSTMECPYAKTMTRSLQTASALPTSSKGQSWDTPALTSSYSQSTAHRFELHPGHRCSDSRQAPSTDCRNPAPVACTAGVPPYQMARLHDQSTHRRVARGADLQAGLHRQQGGCHHRLCNAVCWICVPIWC